jgi:mono/diheme cytochrome c family protein
MSAPRSLASFLLAWLALEASLSASPSASPPNQDGGERARKLFVTNCATCHGETGDGKGTTQLDRPARSFKDGGFSFGNTPEALFRTISVGIPGTPMPAFDSSLSEDDRKLVASYVVTLGPPVEEVKEEDMILAVHDKPLVVRGHLPPIAEGLPHHPRGLLIGDASGITFEYTVDDVRLLALRQGGFVKRTDWSGRGGTPLEPLGKVVYVVDGGKPGPMFSLGAGAFPLEAHLAGTRVDDDVTLDYHLSAHGGDELAHVVEAPRIAKTRFGTGFERALTLSTKSPALHLAFHDATQGPGDELWKSDSLVQGQYGDAGARWRSVRKTADGAITLHAVTVWAEHRSRRDGVVIVDLQAGKSTSVQLETIPIGEWSDALLSQLEHEAR